MKAQAATSSVSRKRKERVYDAEAQPAQDKGPLEHDVEERQRTGLHPLRSHLACGYDEGHRRPHPRCAGDDEHGRGRPARGPDDQYHQSKCVGERRGGDDGVEVEVALQSGKSEGRAHGAHPAERQEEPIVEGRGVQIVSGEEREAALRAPPPE